MKQTTIGFPAGGYEAWLACSAIRGGHVITKPAAHAIQDIATTPTLVGIAAVSHGLGLWEEGKADFYASNKK